MSTRRGPSWSTNTPSGLTSPHFEPVSPAQMAEIEMIINHKIMECLPVTTTEEDLEAARKEGAMALFSEKYGDRVRVVKVSDYSMELCGGTHVKSTGELGPLQGRIGSVGRGGRPPD